MCSNHANLRILYVGMWQWIMNFHNLQQFGVSMKKHKGLFMEFACMEDGAFISLIDLIPQMQ